jgi:hypothetical protein
MTLRSLLFAAALLLTAPLLAGCGPSWIIHTQAAPDPFLNQRAFAVLPIDFTGLEVGEKSEQEYLAGKNPDQQESFKTDKLALNEEYLQAISRRADEAGIRVVPATGPSSAPFLIRPSVAWLEPGYYVGVAAKASEVRMLVRITTPDGRVLDEIAIHSHSGGYASGTRLRNDGHQLGKISADYLKARVGGQ